MLSHRKRNVKGGKGLASLFRGGCRASLLVPVLLAVILRPSPAAGAPPRGNTPEEIEIGRAVAADVDRTTRASADTAAVRRLNEIAAHLAPRTERPLIGYDVRLIEAPVSNAFSLPGGIIYFTDRLVKESRSDDELAGVMAHEIAHNARQHALTRMNRGSTRAMQLADLISLGIFIATKGSGWGQAARLGVSAVTQSVMSEYSVEDEKDADARAIQYLLGSDYDPVGFLTFMERQATLQNQLAEEEMGFYRTHPFSGDRVLVARRALETRGIPIHRRAVGAAPRAVLAMTPVPDSLALAAGMPHPAREDAPPAAAHATAPAVVYEGEVLYFTGERDTASAALHGNVAALNRMLDRVTAGAEIAIEATPEGGARISDPADSLLVTEADARANAIAAPDLARRLRDRMVSFSEAERRRVALLYYLIGNEKDSP